MGHTNSARQTADCSGCSDCAGYAICRGCRGYAGCRGCKRTRRIPPSGATGQPPESLAIVANGLNQNQNRVGITGMMLFQDMQPPQIPQSDPIGDYPHQKRLARR